MMNAQILAKTLVPSGQNAQPIQGKQRGSNASRIQETRQDASDPVPKTVTSNTQDGKTETSDNPKDFKHALTEKMADPKKEQSPEEPQADSPNPTAEMLQVVVPESLLPIQTPAQTPAQTPGEAPAEVSIPLDQTVPDGPDEPLAEIFSMEQPEAQPAGQAPAQDTGAAGEIEQAPVVQISTDLPEATPQEPTQTQAPASSISPEPERSVAPSVMPEDVQPGAEPVMQADTQPKDLSSEQGRDQQPSQAAPLKNVPQPQEQTGSVGPQANVPSQAVPTTSERTTEPSFDMQSMPREDAQEMENRTEPALAASTEQTPKADVPEPVQIPHAVQQGAADTLEPTQSQAANIPETTTPLESAQFTAPASIVSETQAASDGAEAPEALLPRSLDAATPTVSRQIQNSIALGVQQNSRQIVIRLDPPELGRVDIRFQEDSQGITGVLEVQKSQTRYDIQQAMPEIVRQLQDSGVQIKRVEVLLSSDADPETSEDQAFAEAQDQSLEQQQTPEQNRAHGDPSHGWASTDNQDPDHPAQAQYMSDQGLNLLI